jgi:hypothetical protein
MKDLQLHNSVSAPQSIIVIVPIFRQVIEGIQVDGSSESYWMRQQILIKIMTSIR